ncbi:alpha-1,2-galactosyltransferase gmh3 [Schizosaccharomyces japonicus yFS275]|uniref:Alpha-1,2-galactosyltransferase gmh3 n=1 Tax=Schizosaccharomyces japonicus (strain yFS275 / FY16936) TaxID=402676 RepID=B6K5A1_SCHJY|nr:alpha-1,2-galactosyltransferase gmh3 [Schizosaccharomyces japonicus yFS275]EEB08705.1 alpha-1,2-galactosyltransferase gmh3 [Schizosaccharomyces japonicus yFS275]
MTLRFKTLLLLFASAAISLSFLCWSYPSWSSLVPIPYVDDNLIRSEKDLSSMITCNAPKYRPLDPSTPKSHEIVILLASDGHTSNGKGDSFFGECIDNRIAYAKKHNYAFEFVNVSEMPIPPVWAKMPAILATMDKYPKAKWIWWLDQDAIIMNKELSLQDHLLSQKAMRRSLLRKQPFFNEKDSAAPHLVTPSEYSDADLENVGLIISCDLNGLNAGSFFVRVNPIMRMFVDVWSDKAYREKKVSENEQTLLGYLIANHPEMASHVALVPQKMINSYAAAEEIQRYTPGDLLIHFAGCWVENRCESVWREYYDEMKLNWKL